MVGSAAFCYTLYQLLGVGWFPPGPMGAMAMLLPVLTPALISPMVWIPIERASRRNIQLLAEVERTRSELAAEVAERKLVQAQLEELARRDPLTGVLNRRGFFETWNSYAEREVTIATIDVDHFKEVNDRWGHATGDLVLCQIAQALTEAAGKRGCVARLGGDEFVVVLTDDPTDGLRRIDDRLRALAVRLPDGSSGLVRASVGCTRPEKDMPIDLALNLADERMFSAKRSRDRD